MNGEQVAFAVFGLLFVFGAGVATGSLNSGDYWAFRTRRREMEHAERMALIAQRERFLSEAAR